MPTEHEETVITDPTTSTDAPQNDEVQKLKEELSQAKQREAAARKKMDEVNTELKKLKGDGEKKPETQFVTKDELWETTHAKELSIYGDDEYKADIAKGIPRDYALNTAKLRHTAKAEVKNRQITDTGSSERSLGSEDDIQLTPEQISRGITKEMIKKYGKAK